jgi:3-hydroxyisobutyrate dehydrogenase
MGSRMATRLVDDGHHVTVWNRDPDRTRALRSHGAQVAATPRAAAAGAEFVLSMVRDDDASRRVWLDEDDGALAGMSPGAVAIESSTLTVAWVAELAAEAARRGQHFLDAPVAGSRPQAESGQLIFMAGGDADVLARTQPLLRAMGAAVHHAGATGAGAAVKLAINALFGIQVAALAEVLGLLARSGVDLPRAVDIIGSTPVASPAAKAAAATMLAGNYAPMFPVKLVHKDFSYVHALAAGQRQAMPLSDAARGVMGRAIEHGIGDDNLTGIFRLYT